MASFISSVAKAFVTVTEPFAAAARKLERLRFELETQAWGFNTLSDSSMPAVKTAFGIVDLFTQAQTLSTSLDTAGDNEAEIALQLIDVLGRAVEALRAAGKERPDLPFPLNQAAFWAEFGRAAVDGSYGHNGPRRRDGAARLPPPAACRACERDGTRTSRQRHMAIHARSRRRVLRGRYDD
jgi:hypothetical protein